MLTDRIHLQLQRRVIAALPMQDHLDKPALNARDNLLQRRAQNPFACCRTRCRMRPGTLEISAKLHQMLSFLLARWRRPFRVELCDLSLDPVHTFERNVPTALQLASH